MDLAYLRAHPERIPTFLLHQRIRETPVSGGCVCVAQRLTLDDGSSVFAKSRESAPRDFFSAEASGLRWLAEGAADVPDVMLVSPRLLVLEWVEPAPPSHFSAERFGRALAALHRSGAEAFGAPWPGYLGTLELDNTPSAGPWPTWFATTRIEPYLRRSAQVGALSDADVALVDRACGRVAELAGAAGSEPPSRIHGDLWPGNLVWASDRVWLIDPAAHGGHRETDLATLSLFGGAPFLDRIIGAYQEIWPLADGWRDRVPLHQLHLLLAHTAMFGGGYRDAVITAARSLV